MLVENKNYFQLIESLSLLKVKVRLKSFPELLCARSLQNKFERKYFQTMMNKRHSEIEKNGVLISNFSCLPFLSLVKSFSLIFYLSLSTRIFCCSSSSPNFPFSHHLNNTFLYCGVDVFKEMIRLTKGKPRLVGNSRCRHRFYRVNNKNNARTMMRA